MEGIKTYRGTHTGRQIDEAVDKVSEIESRLSEIRDESDKTAEIDIRIPSKEWHIQHALNKNPSVTVLSSQGSEIIADVEYVDTSHIIVRLGVSLSGKVILN